VFVVPAVGCGLWGQVATRTRIPYALTIAAVGMLLAIAATWRCKLGAHVVLDFTPTMDRPMPEVRAPFVDERRWAHRAARAVLTTFLCSDPFLSRAAA
jgi:hypothetical protein